MKRGAARQIQREDGDDPHDVDGDAPLSNGVAAESRSIASRPIRGLPKKKTDSSTSSSAANSFSSTPFTFGGFGSSATNPSTVSTSSSTPLPSPGFTFSTPSTSFASKPATTTSFAFSSPAPASNGHVKVNNDATEELEYYCSLRGLNISLQSQLSEAVSKELEKDTFADLSVLLKSAINRYCSFRSDAEEKLKKIASAKTTSTPAQAQAPPASMPFSSVSTSRESQSSKSAAASAAEKAATSQTSLSATAPTFTPPKLPSSGGFTFAGSSFTAPTSSGAAKNLLPGQPTFSLPKTGFYSTFGKSDGDDDDEGDDDAEEEDEDGNGEGDNEGGESATNEEHEEVGQPTTTTAPSFTAPLSFTPASTTGAGFSSSSSKAQPFSFSSAPTSAFSFGSASKPAASSLSATADPAPTISSSSSSTNSPFRFSFGSNKADNTFGSATVSTSDESSTGETSDGTPTNTSSSFSSPSKLPAIGSNFANTSGVKQGGAFTFGSGKINFGTPSPSPFGSSSTSTGFTFGSSSSKQNDSVGK